jgi:hypothetical protein
MRSLLGVPDPAAGLPRATVPDSPHLWSDLTGHYAPGRGLLTNVRPWQMTGGEVEVLVKKRQLVIRALSPLPALRRGLRLHPIDEDDPLLFAAVAEGLFVPLAFRLDAAGRASVVCLGAPALAQFHRRTVWRSSRVRLRVLSAGLAGAVYRRVRSRRRAPGRR